jgi:hypothetical protein
MRGANGSKFEGCTQALADVEYYDRLHLLIITQSIGSTPYRLLPSGFCQLENDWTLFYALSKSNCLKGGMFPIYRSQCIGIRRSVLRRRSWNSTVSCFRSTRF